MIWPFIRCVLFSGFELGQPEGFTVLQTIIFEINFLGELWLSMFWFCCFSWYSDQLTGVWPVWAVPARLYHEQVRENTTEYTLCTRDSLKRLPNRIERSYQWTGYMYWHNVYKISFWFKPKVLLVGNWNNFFWAFSCLRGRLPSLPWYFLHDGTMILQRIRIIVGDAGFEPGGNSAPEVWCATIEPPHLHATSSGITTWFLKF